ncbi:HTH domain-containing protein [uncultured Tateyamaria sp.]|uniref:helix-turn-helix transcriptional regulator n=1 Tax=uncultured Tateyamaria sp. TaxID=455651 RepID=UPI002633D190|nr:HTH domain-containing protein [uncultured Tateyamaria sp.]
MRASRLLQILLLLQNRGRQTSVQLAEELEVAPRTILRDVDAMTEAGLPIVVHQGNQGGIELGFNYRTRLTGLARDEAQALGLILAAQNPMIAALGLEQAARQARAKLVESLPDTTRRHSADAMARFVLVEDTPVANDRVRALAKAVAARTVARIRFATQAEQVIHPIGLKLDAACWSVYDGATGLHIPEADWGRINMSSQRFEPPDAVPR